jgi:hypothetical protein
MPEPELTEQLEKGLKGLDSLLLAIRASGGHKYRASFKGSNKEIDQYIEGAVPKLQGFLLSLIVAEKILQEPCTCKKSVANLWRGCSHKRWDEYLKRKVEAVTVLKNKLLEDAKKMQMKPVPAVPEKKP